MQTQSKETSNMLKYIIVLIILGTALFFLFPLAISETLISDVHWTPMNPKTNDKIRVYARVTDPSGIKSVQLYHMLLRHFSEVGHMTCVEDDIWAIDIGPYDRNSINVRLVVQNGEGKRSTSDVYTINMGKYRALVRKYIPWAVLLLLIGIALFVYGRLKRRTKK